MAFKGRVESDELKSLRILNIRMELSEQEKRHLFNLEKGYDGEVNFDLLTEKLQNECYVLNDLLLKSNNSSFQIDTTIIYQEPIYLIDVKNHKGDFIYKTDRLESLSGRVYPNPLDQLNRSSTLFRQLMQNIGYNFPVESFAVFVDPEFTLYQAPQNLPFIFPTQLNQFMKKLNKLPSKLNNRHRMLAERLVSLHQTKSPYSIHPVYYYNQCRKGFTCAGCRSFELSISADNRSLVCIGCGYEERIESAILRSVEEIKLLFPNLKITTNIVHDWCGGVGSKKRINRVLQRNFTVTGYGKWTYYE
ncbi:nuclease-related domain-containing protein [Neobacillus drentensis]|uniref:nuclease-related domain-containing protein n=1 Tax=Neobacillus drentensis TaxID=220684 RepID=UPI0030033FBE